MKLADVFYNTGIVMTGEKYQVLAKSKRYALVLVNGCFRVENLKGLYQVEVPHVEIPHELADTYVSLLVGYKYEEPGMKRETKADDHRQFDLECDEMFDHEHTVLYPECARVIHND